MQFESWSAFWQMGGYGFYVWLSFSVSIGAMLLLVIEARYARTKLKQCIVAEIARKERIQGHKNSASAFSQEKTFEEDSQ